MPFSLVELYISNNKIKKIRNLPYANFEGLDISFNRIKNIDLSIDDIEYLNIKGNKIEYKYNDFTYKNISYYAKCYYDVILSKNQLIFFNDQEIQNDDFIY